MQLTSQLIGHPVSVYCEHTVASGILQAVAGEGIRLEFVRFRMRAGASIGAAWKEPWAIIPWCAIDYIGPAEPE